MTAITTVENTAIIERPIGDVWAFASDARNEPRWHTDILEVRSASGPDGGPYTIWRLGDTLLVTVQFMGRNDYEVEVTGLEEGRRLELTTRTGPMRPTATYHFEPEDGSTRFTRTVEMPFRGPMRLMAPLIRRNLKKRNARFVDNLKSLLEK
jgi:uncharacterized protein YndB with AHSA1/START domain